jgi:hypothetical protein
MEELEQTPSPTLVKAYEAIKNVAVSVGSFALERLTQSGDYQMAQDTTVPVYFHESYPLYGEITIVLGEE